MQSSIKIESESERPKSKKKNKSDFYRYRTMKYRREKVNGKFDMMFNQVKQLCNDNKEVAESQIKKLFRAMPVDEIELFISQALQKGSWSQPN